MEMQEMATEEYLTANQTNITALLNPQPTSLNDEITIAATNSTCVTTSILVVMNKLNKTSQEFISCGTANGKQYSVAGVPDEVVQANKHHIMNGDIELSVTEGAYLSTATATLEMPKSKKNMQFFKAKRGKDKEEADKNLFDRTRRSLAVTGTRSALAIRVIASGVVTSVSEATLSNRVFGSGADGTVDPITMKSHFNTCIHGQLHFVPAANRDGRTLRIRNGAITVSVNYPIIRDDYRGLANAVIAELNSQFGVTNPNQLANHLMYFLPPGVIPGIALGYVPGDETLYDNGWSDASVLMHEVGHNLGMGHSGDSSGEYGDESCIMGGGFSENGALLCYNAAKSWQMGWFASRDHTYNVADGMWNGRLIGQVDYANGNDSTSKVDLKLNTPGSDDYFVMFNRIKTGTVESMNKVMITLAGGEGVDPSQSTLVAVLGQGESAVLPYFHLWESLEVIVNKIDLNANPAYADVTVKMGCLHNCGATLETWTGIGGESVADLKSGTNNFANMPQKLERLQYLLEAPSNVGDNYGSRMSGWLVPPVTGDYTFFIASDDNGEFHLSTDGNPANKVLACKQPFSASPRWWDRYPEQKSGLIRLEAGKSYYYEVLMKEGGGGDNLAIAWQYPGKTRDVIPAEFSRVTNPYKVGANLDTWTGIGGMSIADLKSGKNNLTNQPQMSERLQYLLEAPSNVGDNYGSRMSGWLVPPVTGDYTFFIASDDNGEFYLSTDGNPANKVLACKQPFSASPRWWDKYPEQKSGLIRLEAGKSYYYEALMKEGGGGDNLAIAWNYTGLPFIDVIPARHSRTELTWMEWGLPNFGAKLQTWTGIGGMSIADLKSGTNNFANPPQRSEFLFTSLEAPSNWNDNYGIRMSGWLVPPVTGNYVFWIASDDCGEMWLGTNADPGSKGLICRVSSWSSKREWDKNAEQKSGSIFLVAGQAIYYEALMKEGGGNDHLAIAWEYPGQSRVVIPAKFSRLEPKVKVIQQPAMPTPPPTPLPTSKPSSIKPTVKPITSKPTSRKPTVKPVSRKPSPKPTSKAPTRKPV